MASTPCINFKNKNTALLCIAHRGAMGHEPENTLAAFQKAIDLGVKCIELDVYYIDGKLLVFHDDLLERTTNGKGLITEKSFNYLRSSDAGNDQQIPTLKEVCDLVKNQVRINIELKGKGTVKPVVKLISQLVEQGWRNQQFIISSFELDYLVEMRALKPDILIGVLIGKSLDNVLNFAQSINAYSVNTDIKIVTKEFVTKAHKQGFKVYVYTVDKADEVVKMQKMGVDGVFTGFPLNVLNHYQQPED